MEIAALCAIEIARKPERAYYKRRAEHKYYRLLNLPYEARYAFGKAVAATREADAYIAHKIVYSAEHKLLEIGRKPSEYNYKRHGKQHEKQRAFKQRGQFSSENLKRSAEKSIGIILDGTRFCQSRNKYLLRLLRLRTYGSVRI